MLKELSNKTLHSYRKLAKGERHISTAPKRRFVGFFELPDRSKGIKMATDSIQRKHKESVRAAKLERRNKKDTKMPTENYSKDAVDKAIASSNRSGRKIGKKEASSIHRLLKGWRHPDNSSKSGFKDAAVTGNPRDFAKEEVHSPGTKVSVPHKGKMVSGKVVRHDKGEVHGSPFYIVDVGEYASTKIPSHKVKKEDVQMTDETIEEMMTRKHFKMVADVIKAHPDPKKRKELADHHAGIFKRDNPRFDHGRFYAAANAEQHSEETDMSDITTEQVLEEGPKALLDAILDGNKDEANDIVKDVLAAKMDVTLIQAKKDVASRLFNEEESFDQDALIEFLSNEDIGLPDEELISFLESLNYSPTGRHLLKKDTNSDKHVMAAKDAEHNRDWASAKKHWKNAAIASIHGDKERGTTRNVSLQMRGKSVRKEDIEDVLDATLTDEQFDRLMEWQSLWRPKQSGFTQKGMSSKRPDRNATKNYHSMDAKDIVAGMIKQRATAKKTKTTKKKVSKEEIESFEYTPLNESSLPGQHHQVFADLTGNNKMLADRAANSFMRGNITADHKREIMRHFNLADEQLGKAKDKLGTAKSAEHLNAAATHITDGNSHHNSVCSYNY